MDLDPRRHRRRQHLPDHLRARATRDPNAEIKSADGTTQWPQFNPTLVSTLHGAHLNVCAWQYVYGQHPILEAEAAAVAVRDGADCLVIDAEVEYQGRYVQAERYITKLRSLIGPKFPVALAGFPWIDYHPSFPYSIFLGPGGAQYNTPQMYWQDIGVSVAERLRPHICVQRALPAADRPARAALALRRPSRSVIFRAVSRAYGARGVSWWDWQAATLPGLGQTPRGSGRSAVSQPQTTVRARPGSAGDVVVWAQEHLLAAGETVTIDGTMAPDAVAVEAFQQTHNLPVTGVITPATWAALLAYRTPAITWRRAEKQLSATVTPAIDAPHAASGRARRCRRRVPHRCRSRPTRSPARAPRRPPDDHAVAPPISAAPGRPAVDGEPAVLVARVLGDLGPNQSGNDEARGAPPPRELDLGDEQPCERATVHVELDRQPPSVGIRRTFSTRRPSVAGHSVCELLGGQLDLVSRRDQARRPA